MRFPAGPSGLVTLSASLALSSAAGCRCDEDVFQRMEAQPKYLPYQPSPLFEDGRAMRTPPFGTMPREALATGDTPSGATPDAGALTRIPVEITAATMARGQQRFEITCAACHGLAGDGDSMVARNMSLRPPPSLLSLSERPVGAYFDVITNGFGLMPSYRGLLPPEDRWAVVAYVLALQRSQRATLGQAPPAERARLEAAP